MPIHDLLSPLPGTFYRRPSPEAPPFKEPGATLSLGDVVALIEVMKQFSEVTAEVQGRLVEFAVEDGEMVEAGQLLARIDVA